MANTKTHFEQVPLKVVKGATDPKVLKPPQRRPDNVTVERPGNKTEPYTRPLDAEVANG